MQAHFLCRIAVVGVVLLTTVFCAEAARSGSSGSSSGASRSGSSSAQKSTPGRSAFGAARSSTQRSAAGAPRARPSLLSFTSQPSSKLQTQIRERESSGPGWLGTAFLISLLSQHDLSSSDRGWIESRIQALRAAGGNDDGEVALRPPVVPVIGFRLAGLQPQYAVGTQAAIAVHADRAGSAVAVACELPGLRTEAQTAVHLDWTPRTPGVFILHCTAEGHSERRLLRVVAPTPP